MSKTTDSISTTCVLCCQDAKLFAIGPCDHPICAKCSTRMRVLCEQKYCSVCRNDMGTVIFVKKVHPFASIISHKYLHDKKAGVRFSTGWMKNEFEDFLCHKCPLCPKDANKFKTMNVLEEHMRRNHELYYCNLCLDNVKVFTSERILYNRKDLAVHKRKGDPDNTSYRGHPLCEFCDVRFYDNDELLKHLRRQHYYCHFCENDGISNQYYDKYENLRHHFKDQHYLCEEEGCIDEEFTAAFRSDIDLKAHKASKHTGRMSKKEARQARQLDWEFNYTSNRTNHREGVVTGADYNETHGSLRGRGRGTRYHSNRDRDYNDTERAIEASLQPDTSKEQRPPRRRDKPTERAIEASLQPDTSKEQRPPKRRDKPRVEKTEKVPQVAAKPDEKKQRPVKEDEFEKRRAAASSAANGDPVKKLKETKLKSNPVNELSDWSMGNKLTSCQFTESTWTNEGEKSPKVSKAIKSVEKIERQQEIAPAPKRNEPTPVKNDIEQSLQESDFPSLGGKAMPSSAPGWSRVMPAASEFPSLGSAAKPHKLKPTQSKSFSLSAAVSKESELKVDFSKAIATNAMLHDKKKKAAFKPPPPPPPHTQSYNDFPTLSSIADILNPEPQQAWTKSKQPSVVKNVGKSSKPMNSQTTGQQKVKEKSGTEKGQLTAKSKPDKGNKSKSTNGLNDQPKYEKVVEKPKVKKENPTVDKTPDKTSKTKDGSSRNVDSDTKRNKTPPGFQQAPDSKRQPPGLSAPPSVKPPGFESASEFMPPPGFSAAAEFIEPNNFKRRNKDLVDSIQSHLNYDPEGFDEFKRLSGQFRQGFLAAEIYYRSCSDLLGRDNFQSVFPDLVALLPDTIKQQELLLVNNDYKILAKEKGEKVLSIKKKGSGSSAWNSKNQTTKCNNCSQVILQKDLISHTNSCSVNTDFPSLSAASTAPRQTSTAWGRVK